MIVLETDRLLLRQLTHADAAFMLRLLNDPSFMNNIGDRGVRTLAEAEQYLDKGAISSYAKLGFGLYLVELKNGLIPIGISGLVKRDTLQDVDIGFAFFPDFGGKGYAFESAAAVLAYARDTLKFKRLVAITSPKNASSIRLIEKLGLVYEKTLILNQDGSPTLLYGCDLAPVTQALIEGEDFYYEGHLFVFTEKYHLKRGYCCKNNCKHCPY